MKMTGEKKQTKKSLGQEILTLKEQVKEIEPLKEKVFELLEIVNNLKIKENNLSERFPAKEILQEAINCYICGNIFATKKEFKNAHARHGSSKN
jgi:hypothetical protein